MGAENKAANKVTEIRGRIKKKTGQVTNDEGLGGRRPRREVKGRPEAGR
jgi:uncharacterized protein YjbJ (UPF0337 family)